MLPFFQPVRSQGHHVLGFGPPGPVLLDNIPSHRKSGHESDQAQEIGPRLFKGDDKSMFIRGLYPDFAEILYLPRVEFPGVFYVKKKIGVASGGFGLENPLP